MKHKVVDQGKHLLTWVNYHACLQQLVSFHSLFISYIYNSICLGLPIYLCHYVPAYMQFCICGKTYEINSAQVFCNSANEVTKHASTAYETSMGHIWKGYHYQKLLVMGFWPEYSAL